MVLNLEAQEEYYVGYPLVKRGIYYISRMISAQHGTVFTDDNYGLIKPCFGIWVVLNPPKYRQNTLSRYSIEETNEVGTYKEPKKNYDLATVIMICLGDPEAEECTGIIRLLSVLFSLKIDIEEKRKILREEYGIEMDNKMEQEALSVCNFAEAIWTKGIREGREEGKLLGIIEGKIEVLKNILKNSEFSLEDAMQLLGIAEEDRPMFREKLNM